MFHEIRFIHYIQTYLLKDYYKNEFDTSPDIYHTMTWKMDSSGRCYEHQIGNRGVSKPDYFACIQPQLLPAIKFLFETNDKNQMMVRSGDEDFVAEDEAPLKIDPSATGMQNGGVGDSGSGHFIKLDDDYILVGITKEGSAVTGAYGHMLKLTDKKVNTWIKQVADIKGY